MRLITCFAALLITANRAYAEEMQSDAEAESAVLGLLALSVVGIIHALHDLKRLGHEQPYHTIRMENIGWKKNKRKTMSIIELSVCAIAAASSIIMLIIYG